MMKGDWIKRVLVVGSGTMGHSIAMVFAQRGYEVDLVDINRELLTKALSLIRSNLETLGRMEMITSHSIPKTLKKIHPSTSLEVAAKADFVIEAISESPKAKRELFHSLDQICPQRTILASNTSYLDIFALVKTKRPQKVLITHWWAPPHLIPLVDVVKGPRTSKETVETIRALLVKLGKTPVVMKKFIPGYIVNRLQRAMAREIFYLLDHGYASAMDIDTAMKNSLGIRIPVVGVVQRYDFAGLDFALTVLKNPSIRLVSKDFIPKTLAHLVKKGHLGVKSGKGFYDYSSRKMSDVLHKRDIKLIETLKFFQQKKLLG
jgi:3-hydroxybutyryl-CoA dehydrogenase